MKEATLAILAEPAPNPFPGTAGPGRLKFACRLWQPSISSLSATDIPFPNIPCSHAPGVGLNAVFPGRGQHFGLTSELPSIAASQAKNLTVKFVFSNSANSYGTFFRASPYLRAGRASEASQKCEKQLRSLGCSV